MRPMKHMGMVWYKGKLRYFISHKIIRKRVQGKMADVLVVEMPDHGHLSITKQMLPIGQPLESAIHRMPKHLMEDEV